MMQKKYLLVSLLAAATLLSGCSSTSNETPPLPSGPPTRSVTTPPRTDGLVNPSKDESKVIDAKTFEQGAMDIVRLPAVVTEKPDYVPVPFEPSSTGTGVNGGKGVSGSIIDSPEETVAVYNTADPVAAHKWVAELEKAGWVSSKMDLLDTATSYTALLTKPDHRTISIYSNNTGDKKNTLISFSK